MKNIFQMCNCCVHRIQNISNSLLFSVVTWHLLRPLWALACHVDPSKNIPPINLYY